MMILNAILNTSHRRGTLFNPLISFLPISCSMDLLQKIKNRKYDIFFNSCFTENMIFPSIVENQENMIFMISAFMKLVFMQCQKFLLLMKTLIKKILMKKVIVKKIVMKEELSIMIMSFIRVQFL